MKKALALFLALLVLASGTPPQVHAAHVREAAPAAPAPAPAASASGLYRTRIRLPHSTSRARLDLLGVVVLREWAGGALILAGPRQLEALARLGFRPRGTDDLGALVRAHARAKPWLARALEPLLAQAAHVASLEGGDGWALDEARAGLVPRCRT